MRKFTWSTVKSDNYIHEIDKILEAVEQPTALVSDLSQFFDFTIDPSYGETVEEQSALQAENDRIMQKVRTLCGTNHIYEHDTLVFAAEQLRNHLNAG